MDDEIEELGGTFSVDPCAVIRHEVPVRNIELKVYSQANKKYSALAYLNDRPYGITIGEWDTMGETKTGLTEIKEKIKNIQYQLLVSSDGSFKIKFDE